MAVLEVQGGNMNNSDNKPVWKHVCIVVGNEYYYGKSRDPLSFAAVKTSVQEGGTSRSPRFCFAAGVFRFAKPRSAEDLKNQFTIIQEDTRAMRLIQHIPAEMLAKQFLSLFSQAHKAVEDSMRAAFFAPTLGDQIKANMEKHRRVVVLGNDPATNVIEAAEKIAAT
jgi:hypothetical protein